MIIERIAVYEETLLGLPYPVKLIDLAETVTDNDGLIGTCVPNAEAIAVAVAKALLESPILLTEAEIRFIRRTGQKTDLLPIKLASRLNIEVRPGEVTYFVTIEEEK